MSIPDYISPIVGYRTWLWDNVGLRSLCGERWHPGRVLAARCRAAAVVGTIAGRAEGDDAHDAPQANCTCGVYASKSFEHLHTTKYARCGLYGEVNLWGTVVEHEHGWRTQFAYPKSLYLPPDTLPHSSAPIQNRLRGLIAYGVNIFVGDDIRNVPLWTKDSGLNSAGLDHLIEIGKEVLRSLSATPNPKEGRSSGGEL